MSNKQKLISSTFFLSIAILISKVMGLFREMFIAKYFGASANVDAYVIATRIPTFVSTVITIGIGVSVVAVFSEYLAKNQEEDGWLFLKQLIKILLPLLSIIFLLIIIFAPVIVKITAPGFNLPTFKLAVILVRITAAYFLFQELGSFVQAILQSYQKYTLIILWQIIPNIIILSALIFAAKNYGIVILATAFTLTGIVYFLFLLPGVLKLYKPTVFTQHKTTESILQNTGVRNFFKMIIPIALVASSSQLVFLIENFLASYLEEGSIATLKYAFIVYLMPIQIITSTVVFMLYPVLANYYGAKNIDKFKETIFTGMRIIIFLLLPLTIFFVVLSLPIARVLYERGALLPADTLRISQVLKYFSFGIIAYVLADFFSKVFFAMQDTKTPMKTGFIGVFFNIFSSIIFVKIMQIKGLALAASLTAIINCFLLYLFLRKILKLKIPKDFIKFVFSISLVGTLCSFFLLFLLSIFENEFFLATLEKRIFAVGTMSTLMFILYFLLSYILKIPEEKLIWEHFVVNFWKKVVKVFEIN